MRYIPAVGLAIVEILHRIAHGLFHAQVPERRDMIPIRVMPWIR